MTNGFSFWSTRLTLIVFCTATVMVAYSGQASANLLLQSYQSPDYVLIFPAGQRPLSVIVYLPHNCSPCFKPAIDVIRELRNHFAKKKVQILLVSDHELWRTGREKFSGDRQLARDLLSLAFHDPGGRLRRKFNLGDGTTLVVIDHEGKMRLKADRVQGGDHSAKTEAFDEIERLLGEWK